MTFYHPTDGYLYGWRWSTGEEAWWSTEDLALRHPRDIAGQPGEPIRRRYVVGEVETWDHEPTPDEPPLGSRVVDRDGDKWVREERGWRMYSTFDGGEWNREGWATWERLFRFARPLRVQASA